MSPAILKMLSDGTDVAEIKQYLSIISYNLPIIASNVNQKSFKSN
jgi:hypothetical protein